MRAYGISPLAHCLAARLNILDRYARWSNRKHCDQEEIGSGIQLHSFLSLAAGSAAEPSQRLRFLGNNKQLKETWGLG